MALEKQDLQDIRGVVEDAVEKAVNPYFQAIQNDFASTHEQLDRIDKRLDHIEKFLLEEHRRRIEKLEDQVKNLWDALAIK